MRYAWRERRRDVEIQWCDEMCHHKAAGRVNCTTPSEWQEEDWEGAIGRCWSWREWLEYEHGEWWAEGKCGSRWNRRGRIDWVSLKLLKRDEETRQVVVKRAHKNENETILHSSYVRIVKDINGFLLWLSRGLMMCLGTLKFETSKLPTICHRIHRSQRVTSGGGYEWVPYISEGGRSNL